jgi:hypothetical protein
MINRKISVGKLISRTAILLALATSLMLVSVMADVPDNGFSNAAFQKSLKVIAEKFGVSIIADPWLDGPAHSNIQGDTIEAALQALLTPLGYSYTKVDNYYLVSGPKSPLTIVAETDSALVPVGYLNPAVRERLSEFKQYLTYDESSGVVYVKAPSSQMKAILSRLWQISNTSGKISVVYSLQIVDLGNSKDLDFLFSGVHDNVIADKKELVLTPEQWSMDGRTQLILKLNAESHAENIARQPWMITLPGKTVQLRSSIRSISNELDTDRYFTLRITPLRIDESTGGVTSDVFIERSMFTETNFTTDNAVKEVNEPVNKVATVVNTTPGEQEIVAVVRQIREIRRRWLWWFGKVNSREHRDFIVLMNATPVNVQSTVAISSGLLPVASLNGLEWFTDEPGKVLEPILELGISGARSQDKVRGWFNFTAPMSQLNSLMLDYRNDDRYSAGLSFGLDSETSFKFLAGKGVGPDEQDALMFGITDITRPAPYLSLFAEYYPWSYLFDSKKVSEDGVWLAGARLGTEKFGVSLSGTGDPDYDGWLFRLDYTFKKSTWLMEIDHTREDNPTLSLGLGFQF